MDFLFVLQTCQVKGYFSKQLIPRRSRKAAKRHSVWPCAIEPGQCTAEEKLSAIYCGKPLLLLRAMHKRKSVPNR